MRLSRIYPITDRTACVSHVEQVAAFARGGATIIQIRDKVATGRELYEIVVAAVAMARPLGAHVIVNDRVDVALAAGADGVHVGQDDLAASDARALVGAGRIVGVSTHSTEQARAASALPVDYVAVGPVFATATKENPDPVIGLEVVSSAKAVVGTIPLVAIGGITIGNASRVIASGADSVAVIADLWRGAGPEQRVAEYLAALGT